MAKIEYEVNPRWTKLFKEEGFAAAFGQFSPYAGANIQVKSIDDFTVQSEMTLIEANTNYVNTHFGGSLYSMCDPFFMFILIRNLGPDFIVWDKSATIHFLKPGRGRVTATFHISPEEIDRIKAVVAESRKMDWKTECEVIDEKGTIVARIEKILYIRGPKR